VSRNGVDHTRRFRGLAAAEAKPSLEDVVAGSGLVLPVRRLAPDWAGGVEAG